jgi:hypothetical protein
VPCHSFLGAEGRLSASIKPGGEFATEGNLSATEGNLSMPY